MNSPKITEVLKQEMSSEVQAGYKCAVCNVVNVTFGPDIVVPTTCLNCAADSSHLSQTWKHKITTTSITETV